MTQKKTKIHPITPKKKFNFYFEIVMPELSAQESVFPRRKRPHTSYTKAQKLAAINYLRTATVTSPYPPYEQTTVSAYAAAKKFGITQTRLMCWVAQEERIKDMDENAKYVKRKIKDSVDEGRSRRKDKKPRNELRPELRSEHRPEPRGELPAELPAEPPAKTVPFKSPMVIELPIEETASNAIEVPTEEMQRMHLEE